MLTRHNPGTVAPPFAPYAHGVAAPAGARWLHLAGQVGVRPDGTMAEGVEAQSEQAFLNIFEILQHAGMSRYDLVKITVFLLDRQHLDAFRAARGRLLPPVEPASTLVIVAGLARPDFLVEIEAIAAA